MKEALLQSTMRDLRAADVSFAWDECVVGFASGSFFLVYFYQRADPFVLGRLFPDN